MESRGCSMVMAPLSTSCYVRLGLVRVVSGHCCRSAESTHKRC